MDTEARQYLVTQEIFDIVIVLCALQSCNCSMTCVTQLENAQV